VLPEFRDVGAEQPRQAAADALQRGADGGIRLASGCRHQPAQIALEIRFVFGARAIEPQREGVGQNGHGVELHRRRLFLEPHQQQPWRAVAQRERRNDGGRRVEAARDLWNLACEPFEKHWTVGGNRPPGGFCGPTRGKPGLERRPVQPGRGRDSEFARGSGLEHHRDMRADRAL